MLFLIVKFVLSFPGHPVETQNLRLYIATLCRAVSAVLSFPLIITILRRIRDKQPRERELPCDGITIHHLLRNVQIDAIVVLVGVKVQRTIRHKEEVFRSKIERVCRGGSDGGTCLL